jgi:hypothetical protein
MSPRKKAVRLWRGSIPHSRIKKRNRKGIRLAELDRPEMASRQTPFEYTEVVKLTNINIY